VTILPPRIADSHHPIRVNCRPEPGTDA